jgi:hypothetical protein
MSRRTKQDRIVARRWVPANERFERKFTNLLLAPVELPPEVRTPSPSGSPSRSTSR